MIKKIKNNFRWLYAPVMKVIRNIKSYDYIKNDTNRLDLLKTNSGSPRVFYLGITQHSNLGDMAQHFCIKKWISLNYPNAELIMFEATTVVDNRFNFIARFKNIFSPTNDIIVFQSGYTTTDLGGYHEYMHRLIVESMPYAKILMMPQTIFFVKKSNQEICATTLNEAHRMLFLARDSKSYEQAKIMFPKVKVLLFPDIVTTLIGTYHFNYKRKGICMCLRNDSEKLYSTSELSILSKSLATLDTITITDTTLHDDFRVIRSNLKDFIEREIDKYAHFKILITDRYHGTIFSLAASTPVIILKTTDHKVITGADWFKGIYDGYIYVAENLDEVKKIAEEILKRGMSNQLEPYFYKNYYSKLKNYFEEI